ncbi:MAG TPA: phage holin family protein [Candidatus Dormibacteraeota bacterium]
MTNQQGRRFDDPSDMQAPGGTGGLIQRAITEASHLITAEIQLAKQEIAQTLRAAVMAFVTGALAAFGLIAFLIMGIVTLVVAIPLHWVAALACAIVFLIIAIAGASIALGRVKRLSPLRQTIQTIKEDVEWAKQQMTLEEK